MLFRSHALEQAMDKLLGDPAYLDKLGREAAGIQERLAPERVNRLWQEYFERIMNKKGKGAAS